MDRAFVGRAVRRTLLGAAALFLLIQLVPYGWRHPNPPVTQDAPWPDAESAAIARESCYACHSNETDWPAYSYVAPFSWLVRSDVESGRDELNFSTWDRDDGEADDAIEAILEESMPPTRYTLIHRGARLTDDEAQRLVDALAALDRARNGGGDDDDGGDSGGGGGRH
jgi:Haem-binding domain